MGGLALALLFTASPLGVSVLACAPAIGLAFARRLDRSDRRILLTILGTALIARVVAVLGLFAIGLPDGSTLSQEKVPSLAGKAGKP